MFSLPPVGEGKRGRQHARVPSLGVAKASRLLLRWLTNLKARERQDKEATRRDAIAAASAAKAHQAEELVTLASQELELIATVASSSVIEAVAAFPALSVREAVPATPAESVRAAVPATPAECAEEDSSSSSSMSMASEVGVAATQEDTDKDTPSSEDDGSDCAITQVRFVGKPRRH